MSLQVTTRISILIAMVLLASGCVNNSGYRSQGERYVYADVVDYQPVYGDVRTPQRRQVCYEERVEHRSRPSAAGPILGAIAGALIGNAIDGGYNRGAGTFIGGVAGAAIGGSVAEANAGPGGVSYQEVCDDVVEYRNEHGITGYDVIYRYDGFTGQTFAGSEPGQTIQVPWRQVQLILPPAQTSP